MNLRPPRPERGRIRERGPGSPRSGPTGAAFGFVRSGAVGNLPARIDVWVAFLYSRGEIMQDVALRSANPCSNAKAFQLLIPQDNFGAFPWGQGINRPFGNFASHWSATLLQFNPGITGVSPEFVCATSTVGLRRRYINEIN